MANELNKEHPMKRCLIALLVLALNILGDALNMAFNPKARKIF